MNTKGQDIKELKLRLIEIINSNNYSLIYCVPNLEDSKIVEPLGFKQDVNV